MHFEMKKLSRQVNNLVQDIKSVFRATNFKSDERSRTIEQEVLDLLDEPEAQR
jgi:hypothetical protein